VAENVQITIDPETLPPEALVLVEPLAFLISLVLGQDVEVAQVEQESDQEVESQ
jgi:hypothetical protein